MEEQNVRTHFVLTRSFFLMRQDCMEKFCRCTAVALVLAAAAAADTQLCLFVCAELGFCCVWLGADGVCVCVLGGS